MSHRDRLATWGGNHGKRLPAELYPGRAPVHVIICTIQGRRFFSRSNLAEVVFDLACRSSSTVAACLMPDHLHWLLSGEEQFTGVVQGFKSRSTREAWSLGHTGKLWQRSFYDHVLRRDEAVRAVAEYIVANPVRARLVDEWTEYPYSCLRSERTRSKQATKR